MRYQKLLDMGFKRNDIFANDPVFFKKHGYNCYWLEYRLYQKGPGKMCTDDCPEVYIFIEWDPTEDKFRLITHEKSDITSTKEITPEEMEVLVAISKRTGDIPKDTDTYSGNYAC